MFRIIIIRKKYLGLSGIFQLQIRLRYVHVLARYTMRQAGDDLQHWTAKCCTALCTSRQEIVFAYNTSHLLLLESDFLRSLSKHTAICSKSRIVIHMAEYYLDCIMFFS